MSTQNIATETQNEWNELYYSNSTKEFEGELQLIYKIVGRTLHFETKQYRFRKFGDREAFRLQVNITVMGDKHVICELRSSEQLPPAQNWQDYKGEGIADLGSANIIDIAAEFTFFLNPETDPRVTVEKTIPYKPPLP